MFNCENGEKIFQTLPGQGWRVLVKWEPAQPDKADGFPEHTLEPVIAFVTLKIPRQSGAKEYEDVVIAPLVRWPDGSELDILDSHIRNFVYVAPGEELTEQHFDQLRGGYAKEVTVPCA
jgi:hypothetical protein